ncbi:MAG TPA: hypothetical protein VKE40_23935 [Gemmataceae bacterium]|nr:hypothetical protein [Gemmataceae bacterium]
MRLLPRTGTAIVTQVTMVATLLASWPAAAGSCACANPAPARATFCPCAGTPDPAAKPCCQKHAATGKSCCATPPATADCAYDFCACPPTSTPEPTAPPRPADEFGGNDVLVALLANPVPVAVPPAPEAAAGRLVRVTSPPPTDLVISLSRLTC